MRPLMLSFALVLGLTGTVSAAPASCRLLVDPAGDDRAGNAAVPPPADTAGRDGDLDLLGGDVATNAQFVTAVIRTRSQRGPTSPDSPTGRMWEFFFTVGEQRYIMAAATGPEGYDGIVYRITTEYREGETGFYSGEGIGGARVTLDTKKREVRITAPLAHFAPYTSVSKGKVLRELSMWSFKFHGVGGQRISLPANYVVDYGHGGAGVSADSATSKRTYSVGAKSCVVAGR